MEPDTNAVELQDLEDAVISDQPLDVSAESSEVTSQSSVNIPVPLELQILEFQRSMDTTLNAFLSRFSAIYIESYMDQVVADVHKLAKQQAESIAAQYNAKLQNK